MKPVKTPAAAVKLMVRRADYEYLSTLAVLNGVSIPAALAQILRGIKKNGLSIEFAVKEIPPPPATQAVEKPRMKNGKPVRTQHELDVHNSYLRHLASSFGLCSPAMDAFDALSWDERIAEATPWYEANTERARELLAESAANEEREARGDYSTPETPKPIATSPPSSKEQFLATQPPDMVAYFLEQTLEEQQALLNKWCSDNQDLDFDDDD